MIRAAAWISAGYCGVVANGASRRLRVPDLSSTTDMTELVGQPPKYYPRMTSEARQSFCAASLAMQASRWTLSDYQEIGMVAAGYAGCIDADRRYFGDYVSNGRMLGRGNLFIYTLPTSTLGEIAIALKLAGPTLHIQSDSRPVQGLLQNAWSLVVGGEAVGVLAIWSDLEAAICFAVGHDSSDGPDISSLLRERLESSPMELAKSLDAMINTELQKP